MPLRRLRAPSALDRSLPALLRSSSLVLPALAFRRRRPSRPAPIPAELSGTTRRAVLTGDGSDVTLVTGDLGAIVTAIALSKRTMRTIRQNFFGAFIYNTVLIPVAAGALYPIAGILLSPALAGAAMAGSSVSVVTNSLRLRRFRPYVP